MKRYKLINNLISFILLLIVIGSSVAAEVLTNDDTVNINVLFGQTHLIPAEGLKWTVGGKNYTYHLVGGRDTLVLVEFGSNVKLSNPIVVLSIPSDDPEDLNGRRVFGIPLKDPSQLPKTEANGAPFSTTHYSAIVFAEWIQPGLIVSAYPNDTDYSIKSQDVNVIVGETVNMPIEIVPFFLFGATPSNTNFPGVGTVPANAVAELEQKWPISKLSAKTHAVGSVQWPYMIIGPRAGPPFRVTNTNEMKDGYDVMSAILTFLGGLRAVNGGIAEKIQLYTPIIAFNNRGIFANTAGGLGGGMSGSGDHRYSGIFIHEQGHAFGLPHAGEAYDAGKFPYQQGSLLGSQWGFDINHMELLPPWLPPSNVACKRGHIKDSQGHCMKQSVMQSGAGDQPSTYLYTMFTDFEMSTMQSYFEGSTTIMSNGQHERKGGALIYRESDNSYQQWDGIDKKLYPFKLFNDSYGIYNLDNGSPIERNIPVHTIVMTYSHANVSEVSQIYPYLSYTGNIIRTIDPTNQQHISDVRLNGPLRWFCMNSGCDFTIRVTFSDGSQQYILQNSGVRVFAKPSGAPNVDSTNPSSSKAFFTFFVNVRAINPIKSTELLWTPLGYAGISSNAPVLLSKFN
ncbi:hypothetical protein DFA_11163 [Cavenderia fasciculata]|uniref:Peptidase M66 domain-containing protein n=1 Tax=Cavenderia fasciculata TaxID=261658 RepID=F4QF95_CACFS|nr:uncharacterized protein DFA_11163 [Cavenderia fasciculata]EGG13402.1 hypothetical protein DFA_11163 [Cavenderia fasciculata]|eukprot:XP_004350106.1 hypothetical protein DFA_11163 [Cavenderia fasciculata]